MGIPYDESEFERRGLAGHAGDDGAQDARYVGAVAWLRHRAADRAGEWGCALGELRNALSGVIEARAGGVHRVGMGRVGQQPQGEVLPVDEGGAEASPQRGGGMGADDWDRRAVLLVS